MTRQYTKADVDAIFDELRALVNAQATDDPGWVDYMFRMDAVIRFWFLEMTDHTDDPHLIFEALEHAMQWAGWHATLRVESGTVH